MFPWTVDYLKVIFLKSQNPSFYSGGVGFALRVDLWLENVFKLAMVGFYLKVSSIQVLVEVFAAKYDCERFFLELRLFHLNFCELAASIGDWSICGVWLLL